MKITKRLYTYPVLNNEKDDYMNSAFNVVFSHEMAGVNSLKLDFDIQMDCKTLQEMIDHHEAEFLVHLECSSTAYRITLNSQVPHITKEIPISRLNGTLEIVAFVVTTKAVKNFKSIDWVEDFQGMEFDLEKGSVLAYQNVDDLLIEKDFEEFSNASSIFTIYKKLTNDNVPINVDMEGHKIKIGLGINEYSIYTQFYKNPSMQPVLNSMIILPALVFVFEELKQEDGIDKYNTRKWYIAMKRAYSKRKVDLEEEILNEDKTSIVLAQEAMEYPITSGLDQISSIYEEEE